ncbi:MAG TPA: hypothetical protein PLV08_10040 [Flavobacteriales bacterium]|jgi:hypothetical protein|nr:hypothetical protein [Flavobacteriales bacterium]MBK6551739.1 hypothetical protein [Flavobacteriales bacterium]MBK7101519.1 hypothetical protein [Flavobacteriales bacterium]MBK8532418.1 hypothetical protein [Flavobacteriales bacterium]MBP8877238.1 hypothetical protein [Flavobacteriales bacterium]
MNLRDLSLLPILLFASITVGQGKGEIKLHVSPHNGVEYVLDGKERLSNRGLVLPAGDHRFVFWAPDRKMLDTTLTIVADTTILFYKILPITDAYRAYKVEQKRAVQGRFFYRAIPLVLTATAGVFAWNSNKKDREAYDALVAAEDSYNSLRVPLAITGLKDQVLPSLQADLDAANRRLTMAVALAGVGVVATILGFIKAGRIVEPTYKDKGKVEFDGLVWMPSRNGSSIQLGMHIPIR